MDFSIPETLRVLLLMSAYLSKLGLLRDLPGSDLAGVVGFLMV